MRDVHIDPGKCQSCKTPVLDGNGNPLPGTMQRRSSVGNFFLCGPCHARTDEIRNPLTGAVVGSLAQQRAAAQAARAQLQTDYGPLANIVASIQSSVAAGQSAEALAPTVRGLTQDARVPKAPALAGKQGRAFVDALLPRTGESYRAQIAALIA